MKHCTKQTSICDPLALNNENTIYKCTISSDPTQYFPESNGIRPTSQQSVELTLPSPALHLTLQINSETIQGKIDTMFWLQLMTKYKHTLTHHYIRISVTSVAADVLRLVFLTPFVLHVLQVTVLTLWLFEVPAFRVQFCRHSQKSEKRFPPMREKVHRPEKLRAKTCSPALCFCDVTKGTN